MPASSARITDEHGRSGDLGELVAEVELAPSWSPRSSSTRSTPGSSTEAIAADLVAAAELDQGHYKEVGAG